jgi:hypothetical protein
VEKESAKLVLSIAKESSARVDGAVAIAKDACDPREFVDVRRMMGQIMAGLFEHIMAPIYDEHRDLAPDWYIEMDRRAEERQENEKNE